MKIDIRSGFLPRLAAVLALGVAVSACQSNANKPVDLGIGTESQAGAVQVEGGQIAADGTVVANQAAPAQIAAAEPGRITDVELRAYCPRVTLREGTNAYRTYAGGNTEDPNAVIYQAALGETSRDCNYSGGMLNMTVAVAGRVVPGPKGKSGNITMPIRVAVTRGDEVLYSQLFRHPVTVSETGATQFVFKDGAVSFPQPNARNIEVFIGYDEGPYDTP
ncbi:MAG: hypothetical protein HC779_01215 [Phyllobacteriaceae bacterium]|nr:hypothetical protein [Phyllobacteriaceae bacterium]